MLWLHYQFVHAQIAHFLLRHRLMISSAAVGVKEQQPWWSLVVMLQIFVRCLVSWYLLRWLVQLKIPKSSPVFWMGKHLLCEILASLPRC